MKKGLETGFVYAGAVIGAGFASGRELWQFFGRFGSLGIWGLLFSFFLYFILGYSVFYIIGENKSGDFLSVFGRKGRAAAALNLGFMFVLFVSMTAAAGAMAEEILGISREAGGLFFSLAVYFCTRNGKAGFLSASAVLTPLLIFFGSLCGLIICPPWKTRLPAGEAGLCEVFISGLLYVSYNILSLAAVMFPFKEDFADRRIRFWSSFFGSLIMFILGVCLFPLIVVYYSLGDTAALPVLTVIKHLSGGVLYGIYTGVLFAAVFTTAAGNFFGFAESLKGAENGKFLRIFIIISGYFCSLMGFSEIISIIYPLFGILGLLNILFIVYNSFITIKTKRSIWTKKIKQR